MRRLLSILFSLPLSMCLFSSPQNLIVHMTTDANGNVMLYMIDTESWTAEVSPLLEEDGGPYGRKDYVIQDTLQTELAGQSQGGATGESKKIVDVVGIGEEAFYQSKVKSLTFETSSKFRYIRSRGMAEMKNMSGALTLPEGLQEIDAMGLYSGDEGDKMPVTELVLPSTLDTLGANSVVLDKLERLVFTSMTPPKMSSVFPWVNPVNGDFSTPKDIEVVVPQEAWSTYKNAKGIGDYFSCFGGDDPTDVTELENTPAKACKVMRNGQLLIEKAGVLYTAEGKVVEK